MSKLLRTAIVDRAKVSGELVMVDGFLNHRVEPELIADVARHLSDRLPDSDAIVTSEASGIAPAYSVAEFRKQPMIFAKKRPAIPASGHWRQIVSPTKGDVTWLVLSADAISGIGRAIIIDDFLWGGRTALALTQMLREAEVTVSGAGFCIEKTFGDGRRLLEAEGVRVVAAAVITGIEQGRVIVA